LGNDGQDLGSSHSMLIRLILALDGSPRFIVVILQAMLPIKDGKAIGLIDINWMIIIGFMVKIMIHGGFLVKQ